MPTKTLAGYTYGTPAVARSRQAVGAGVGGSSIARSRHGTLHSPWLAGDSSPSRRTPRSRASIRSTGDAFEHIVRFVEIGLQPHQRDARVFCAFGVRHLLSLCGVQPPRFHEDRMRIRTHDVRRAPLSGYEHE